MPDDYDMAAFLHPVALQAGEDICDAAEILAVEIDSALTVEQALALHEVITKAHAVIDVLSLAVLRRADELCGGIKH